MNQGNHTSGLPTFREWVAPLLLVVLVTGRALIPALALCLPLVFIPPLFFVALFVVVPVVVVPFFVALAGILLASPYIVLRHVVDVGEHALIAGDHRLAEVHFADRLRRHTVGR